MARSGGARRWLLFSWAVRIAGVVCLSATFCIDASAVQQRQGQTRKRDAEIVMVVGCLAHRAGAMWIISNATEPIESNSPATTNAALEEAAAGALGTQTFQLLGIRFFEPERHNGHKVSVKGVLIKATPESRLNVTSLQTVRATCPG
jgi:hypothetical protein